MLSAPAGGARGTPTSMSDPRAASSRSQSRHWTRPLRCSSATASSTTSSPSSPQPAGSFKRASYLLDNSLEDLTWILRVSNYYAASDEDEEDDHIGLPPAAQNKSILFHIWEQITVLQYGRLEACADAAASVVSPARNNDRYGRLIIEENGVPPPLWLITEGRADAQKSAALAIGLLSRDPESASTS